MTPPDAAVEPADPPLGSMEELTVLPELVNVVADGPEPDVAGAEIPPVDNRVAEPDTALLPDTVAPTTMVCVTVEEGNPVFAAEAVGGTDFGASGGTGPGGLGPGNALVKPKSSLATLFNGSNGSKISVFCKGAAITELRVTTRSSVRISKCSMLLPLQCDRGPRRLRCDGKAGKKESRKMEKETATSKPQHQKNMQWFGPPGH